MTLIKKVFYLTFTLLSINQLYTNDAWSNLERTDVFCAKQKDSELCKRKFHVIGYGCKERKWLHFALYERESLIDHSLFNNKFITPNYEICLGAFYFDLKGLDITADNFKDQSTKDITLGLLRVAINEFKSKGITDTLSLKNVKPSDLNLTKEDIVNCGLDFLPCCRGTIVHLRKD